LPEVTEEQELLMGKSEAFVPETTTLLNVRDEVPMLVTVKVKGELCTPTAWFPKLRLEGERLKFAVSPVPVSVMTQFPIWRLLEMVTLPVAAPEALGTKEMTRAQLNPTPSLPGTVHPGATVKGPVATMLLRFRGAPLGLLKVTGTGALTIPTSVWGNVMLVLDSAATGQFWKGDTVPLELDATTLPGEFAPKVPLASPEGQDAVA